MIGTSDQPADAYATGAMVGAGAGEPGRIRAFHHPAEAAERDTPLPRVGRTRNEASRQVVAIRVETCVAADVRFGAPPVDVAGALALSLAHPLEALPSTPIRAWVLDVSIAGQAAQVVLPAHAFSRDEAVEVAWRRIAIVAQRGTMPAQTEG